jgi:hypothetical protein
MDVKKIEVDDEAVSRAQVINLTTETIITVLTFVVYAQMILSDEAIESMKKPFRRLRTFLFGAPPLTEEQIEAMERQVVIEAMRTVRYGE